MQSVNNICLKHPALHTAGLQLLAVAIRRLQQHEQQFTCIHSMLVCLALKARQFDAALQLCDIDVIDILKGVRCAYSLR
jgi:hypothetical protein